MRPPLWTSHPVAITDGCLACGVAAAEEWSPRSATPGTLGGHPSPEWIFGYLCPACEVAFDRFSALGPSALGHRVGWGALAYASLRFAHCALPANAVPWDHLSLVF